MGQGERGGCFFFSGSICGAGIGEEFGGKVYLISGTATGRWHRRYAVTVLRCADDTFFISRPGVII